MHKQFNGMILMAVSGSFRRSDEVDRSDPLLLWLLTLLQVLQGLNLCEVGFTSR